jgi:myosin heavy subunit
MIHLYVLNVPEILYNLQIRYQKDVIYTYIGPTLIVINPYKKLENTYSDKNLKKFSDLAKNC